MKKMVVAMFATIALMATSAHAGDGAHWFVRPDASWTVTDNVTVTWKLTEGGNQVGVGSMNFGTAATLVDQPVDGTQFVGSGRTICLSASAFREAEPSALASAGPLCFRFPFTALKPPTLLSP